MKLILVAVVEAIIDFMLFQVLKVLLMAFQLQLQLIHRDALDAEAFANAIAPLAFVAVVILAIIELLGTLAFAVFAVLVIHQPLTLLLIHSDIIEVICEDAEAISHAMLKLAIINSLQAALHPVEFPASAMELIFKPLSLVAELSSSSRRQLVYDSALSMFHVPIEATNVLVSVAHELLSIAVALAIDPVSLVMGLLSKGETPHTVVFVVVGLTPQFRSSPKSMQQTWVSHCTWGCLGSNTAGTVHKIWQKFGCVTSC